MTNSKNASNASQEKFTQICAENGIVCVPFEKTVAVKVWIKKTKKTDTAESVYNQEELPEALKGFNKVVFENQIYYFA